jgi:hypothetical protein
VGRAVRWTRRHAVGTPGQPTRPVDAHDRAVGPAKQDSGAKGAPPTHGRTRPRPSTGGRGAGSGWSCAVQAPASLAVAVPVVPAPGVGVVPAEHGGDDSALDVEQPNVRWETPGSVRGGHQGVALAYLDEPSGSAPSV